MSTIHLIPNIELLVTKGDDSGKVFETNRFPITIGREESCEFVLEDSSISRKHAVIESDGATVWVKDLGSTNGSFVNNMRIKRKTEIGDGTTFILGNSWIKLIYSRAGVKKKKKNIEPDGTAYIDNTKAEEAFFVVDLENSSTIADQYGNDVALKIAKILNKYTMPCANKNKPKFTKSTGDGFLISFETPRQALNTATTLLKQINKYNKGKKENKQVNIRIALNFGECNIVPNGDRLGHAVNVTFRVEGLKYTDGKKDKYLVKKEDFVERNRIFVTEAFYKELEDSDKLKYDFTPVGNFSLKGMKKPHKIYYLNN
jgi:pSer/pThr/pTyr-binding forkhead associated (FHA) protein